MVICIICEITHHFTKNIYNKQAILCLKRDNFVPGIQYSINCEITFSIPSYYKTSINDDINIELSQLLHSNYKFCFRTLWVNHKNKSIQILFKN